MKNKKLQELRSKSVIELVKLADKCKIELLEAEIAIKIGKEKNLKKGKNIKRDIAQIATIIKEKSLAEALSKTESK